MFRFKKLSFPPPLLADTEARFVAYYSIDFPGIMYEFQTTPNLKFLLIQHSEIKYCAF